MGFPGGPSGKESPCQCGRPKRFRFDRWVWKIPWSRKWQPAPVFLLGESHGQRSLVGYSAWGLIELDTAEHACILWRLSGGETHLWHQKLLLPTCTTTKGVGGNPDGTFFYRKWPLWSSLTHEVINFHRWKEVSHFHVTWSSVATEPESVFRCMYLTEKEVKDSGSDGARSLGKMWCQQEASSCLIPQGALE